MYPPDGTTQEYPQTPATVHQQNVSASRVTDEESLLRKLVDVLSSKQDRLPRMEPVTFDGDILKFVEWIHSFESLIEHYTDSETERLFYLGKYTRGKARATIQWFLSSGSASAYRDAKDALCRRYGDKYKISEAYRKEINNWPSIKPGDGEGLQKFSDFLNQCCSAMSSISYLSSLDSAEENKKLVQKLPRYMSQRWARIVDSWLYGNENTGHSYQGPYPPLAVFCRFLANEARIACGPGNVSAPAEKLDRNRTWKPKAKSTALASQTSTTNDKTAETPKPQRQVQCCFCKGGHYVDKCDKWSKLPTDERKDWARKNGVCFGCLRRGHLYSECRKRNPSLLGASAERQQPSRKPAEKQQATTEAKTATAAQKETKEAVSCRTNANNETKIMNSMVVPVQLYHRDTPEKIMRTYALLDNQSNACFIAQELLDELKAPAEQVDLKLSTMLAESCVQSHLVQDLVVSDINSQTEVALPGTYSRAEIPGDHSLIPTKETINSPKVISSLRSSISSAME